MLLYHCAGMCSHKEKHGKPGIMESGTVSPSAEEYNWSCRAINFFNRIIHSVNFLNA